MLAPGLAAQVRMLHFGAGHTPDAIAAALRIDVGDVTHAIATTPASKATAGQSKKLLNKHVQRAVEVMGELLEDYENPRLQYEAAKFVCEVDLGKHDAKESAEQSGNSLTLQQFNIVVQQSEKSYVEQLKQAGIISDPVAPISG